ncbi:DUF6497 family protein [Pseudoroseicyclus tamaricis]|uniref:Acetolactate synthase n=1 Tax=Pseudoroseicyclus tamaricis TaxID=2705421 RepID=A0A6B2K3A1_9RHOB|nr:DUF6497 family protein [Pseudoroseicyclus tamaricis]NDV01006.1 hypothetical protein [Pseudoroseicyclus tamaricis]
MFRPISLLLLLAAPAAAQDVAAPSGQPWRIFDVVLEGTSAHLRFISEGLEAEDFESIAGDFQWLCDNLALPALETNEVAVEGITISVADRELPFGEMDPEAVQFFEGFRVEDGACVWELF